MKLLVFLSFISLQNAFGYTCVDRSFDYILNQKSPIYLKIVQLQNAAEVAETKGNKVLEKQLRERAAKLQQWATALAYESCK